MQVAVDTRVLRYFSAVVEAGSITRAAEALHIAQPALSLQIRRLEEHMGVPLLERTPKGVLTTPAGQRLYGHAKDILQRLVLARQDVQAASAEPVGRVALGMSQSIAQLLTLPLVRESMRRWPKMQLQIIEASTGYVAEYLRTGHVDIGVTFMAEPGRGLRYRPLASEELVLIGPPKALQHKRPASRRQANSLDFAEVRSLPLLLPAQPHSLRTLIDDYARQYGVKLKIVAEVNTVPLLSQLVCAGIGYSIVPYPSVSSDIKRGLVESVQIVNPAITRSVYLCRWADAPVSPAAVALEGLVVEIVAALIANGSWPARPADVDVPIAEEVA